MNFLILKDLLSNTWQVDANSLRTLLPIFQSIRSGINIELADEPENHKPYAVYANTRELLQGYYADDQHDDPENDSDEEPEMKMVVNVMPIRSILTKHDQECGPRGTRTYGNRLAKADSDPNVIGHILIVESGGGQTNAVPELTDVMQKCTKPIVVWVDGVAASAAYYISSYAKEIIASREMDFIGCIGTMIVYEGRKSKSEANMLGDVQVTIYADGSEEKNEEYEKAINDFDFSFEKSRILNPINDKFKADVTANRPKATPDQLKGRVYFAKDVVGSLVDAIGDFDYAMERVLALANFKPKPAGNSQSRIQVEPKNKVERSMKQFTKLNAVLGVESLESVDESVSLNELQLETIETALSEPDQSASERDQAIQDRDQAISDRDTAHGERDQARTDLTNALTQFDAIDASIAAAETPEAKAQAVRDLLAKQPGLNAIGALTTGDPKTEAFDGFSAEELEITKNL